MISLYSNAGNSLKQLRTHLLELLYVFIYPTSETDVMVQTKLALR